MIGPARRSALAWLLAMALIPVPGAMAQGLSPQVDRDSPAGVEYQLPLDRAREEAAGVLPEDRGADDDIPLFGVGVTRANPRTPRAAADGATSQAERATPERAGAAAGATAPAIVRAQAPPPGGAGPALLAVGAAAAGVLLLGSLAGLAWRRRAMRR